jgi:hypothetical protein
LPYRDVNVLQLLFRESVDSIHVPPMFAALFDLKCVWRLSPRPEPPQVSGHKNLKSDVSTI